MKTIEEMDILKVKELCKKILGEEYEDIERMGGLTNRTYRIKMKDELEYVVRIPGKGTEEFIIRENEKLSTELACALGIDARCLYFDKEGYKVAEYINGAETMSIETLAIKECIKQVAEIFHKLHSCEKNTGVPFEVFDMAAEYEKIIAENRVTMYEDYETIKAWVMKTKKVVDSTCEIVKVPCHNDPLCENWVKDAVGKMYLIDWEYAGMNDAFWDLADVSIEARYKQNEDEFLLKEYLGRDLREEDWRHFYANKIYVDYLWTLWAKARVPFEGQAMEDWATERYIRLKANILQFENIS